MPRKLFIDRITIFSALFVVLLGLVALTLVFSSQRRIAKAQNLEQSGRQAEAIEIYKAVFATTPEYQRGKRAELQYRIGECFLALDRPREAFIAYNKAVEISDKNRMAHIRLGQLYMLSGSVDRASEQAQKALNDGDLNLDALALLGAAAAANGNTEVAKSAFQSVLNKDPSRVKDALALAELLNREGQADAAKSVLAKAAEARPQSSAPWLALGRLEETQAHIEAAEHDYRKAVQIEDVPETNLRLAQFLERTARIPESKAVLRHVDTLRPAFRTALGDFSLMANDESLARQEYVAALDGFSDKKSPDAASRPRTIARLIEADLAGNEPEQLGSKISRIELATRHFQYFRHELDKATAEMLQTELALAANDLPIATVHSDAALQLAPDSAPALYLAGVVKHRAANDTAADIHWEQALDNDPTHIPTRLALADLSLRQGDAKSAENYVIPVVREEPANFRALILFGYSLLAQKELASAAIMSIRAEAVAPNSEEPDLLRGNIALQRDDPGAALIHFQKATLKNPNSKEALQGLTRAYRHGQLSRQALLQMQRIGLQDPPSPPLLEVTGRLFADNGWYEDAEKSFTACLRLDPTRSSAATELARVLIHRGDAGSAALVASSIPGLQQVLQGVQAEQRGDFDTATLHYEAALRTGDTTAIAANNLAWLYAKRGVHLDRALIAAQRAAELAPEEASVLDTLGFVYLQRRDYTEAVRILEHARLLARNQGSPDLAAIEDHLRLGYKHTGQGMPARNTSVVPEGTP